MKRYLIMYKLKESSETLYFKMYAKSLGDAEYRAFDVIGVTTVFCLDGYTIKSFAKRHNRA